MDQYKKAIQLHRDLSEKIEHERQESYKISFRDKTSKSITTMSIGTIAELEKIFGHLWGHGKRKRNLTEDETEWRAEWEILRERILNEMHRTIGKVDAELSKFNFTLKTYTFIKGNRNGIED